VYKNHINLPLIFCCTQVVKFKVVKLELLNERSQSLLAAHQMALPVGLCDLEKVKTQNFLDEEFMGNPQQLIAICDCEKRDAKLQIFELLNLLVRQMIKRALVKMYNMAENDDGSLAGPVRQGLELLVVANAQLRQLDFHNLNLSTEKAKLVNNIGILDVTKKEFYLHSLFSEFLVSVYLIHKFGIEGMRAAEFSESLTGAYPKESLSTAQKLLIENYMNITANYTPDDLPDDLSFSLDIQNIR
jgi:hypothetical protein